MFLILCEKVVNAMEKRKQLNRIRGFGVTGLEGWLQYPFSLTGDACSVTGLTENGASRDLAEVWSRD